MNSSTPTISVLMSVHNSADFLRSAMDSILNQTFTDFEFLIMDDGSRDRSLKILQDYAANDQRIVLMSRENRGLTRTLNELLGQARGEFIARMDADDISLPDRFALQVDFLRQNPEVVCVGGAQDWIDEAGRFLTHRQEALEDAEIQHLMIIGQTSINHPSAMFRRSALLQVGGYDETLEAAQDIDLWLKLGEIGKLANLKDTVLQYRQHDRSVSEQRHLEQIESKRKACKQACQRRGINVEFQGGMPWRPITQDSRYAYLLNYGWWFFTTGRRWDALAYGWRAIRLIPLKVAGWKLLACALIKPLPEASSL